MATQKEIDDCLTEFQGYSSDYTIKYIDAVRFGYEEEAEKLFNILVILWGVIRAYECYEPECSASIENCILDRFGKKALISKNNSLSLESKTEKIVLSESQLNCITEEQLDRLAEKVNLICSTC